MVLGYGGSLVAGGELTAGALTAFLVYTLLIAMGLGTLADIWAEAMRGLGAAERVFDLTERKPGMPVSGGRRLDRVSGRVAYEGVRFRYPTRPDVEVLQGIDLAVEPGQVVALVGPSGGGKSTMGAMLSRLYDPTAGRLTLDGVDIRELDPAWLRRLVGVVSQEP
ncbi:MAG: transporter related, partial [Anaeromyxobacteraceae bacterium]|nr:transporter related [Anaeromyxobacteraceae bacterium]